METEEQDKLREAGAPVFHDVLAVELAAMITKVADSADSQNPVVRVGNELVRLLLTDMPMLRAEYRRTLKRPCSETMLKKEIIIDLLGHAIDRFYGTSGAKKEIDPLEQSLACRDQGNRQDAERLRKTDTIIRLIYEQALEGRIYTANQFAEGFENKEGLGSSRTIRERLSVLATKGHVKFFKNADDYGLPLLARSRQGYLCVDGMMLNTGRLIVPTHYKDPQSGEILPVLYAPGLPFVAAGETEDS